MSISKPELSPLPSAAASECHRVAAAVETRLREGGVKLTMGGEPTYVPTVPEGSEWSITALGPTKLRFGYAFAGALIAQSLPRSIVVFSPGKHYPGEVNPRWSLNLVWRTDGDELIPALPAGRPPTPTLLRAFCEAILARLHLAGKWLRAVDLLAPKRAAWVLPMDHDGRHFVWEDWKMGAKVELLSAEGLAGLRLPLNSVPATASRRALTVEVHESRLHVFLPPFLQGAWMKLLAATVHAARETGLEMPVLAGYVPPDEAGAWTRLAIAADPGVLEVNLPACATWADYAAWLERLEKAAAAAGLRSCKQLLPDEQAGTGGGNHLLFGGPTLDENPLFTHPRWLVAMLRYWQRHPSLAYFFTGHYVGSASQAPRPDESASDLYDLEMAYRFLEGLPEGDHRYLIGETLRHLHTDSTGNTHRSEVSFDKFWNQAFDGGCRGLIEFRAVETLPHAAWMSAVALLWRAIAAMLLGKPRSLTLTDHGDALHDAFFLPSTLWADLRAVLKDLRQAGFDLPEETFRAIYEWRFPRMLDFRQGAASFEIRKALEPWPLLCETPLEGGNTSRFVDTSIERLEFSANSAFAKNHRVFVHGRELPLLPAGAGQVRAGLRYRQSALYPSLHPGIKPHMPLVVTVTDRDRQPLAAYRFTGDSRSFAECSVERLPKVKPCRRLREDLVTCDLRIA